MAKIGETCYWTNCGKNTETSARSELYKKKKESLIILFFL